METSQANVVDTSDIDIWVISVSRADGTKLEHEVSVTIDHRQYLITGGTGFGDGNDFPIDGKWGFSTEDDMIARIEYLQTPAAVPEMREWLKEVGVY